MCRDLNQTPCLSLTSCCFEMHPLSAAGKNKIPFFDKVNHRPHCRTAFLGRAVLSLSAVSSPAFEQTCVLRLQCNCFHDQGSFNPVTFLVLTEEEGKVNSLLSENIFFSTCDGCTKAFYKIQLKAAEIFPFKAGDSRAEVLNYLMLSYMKSIVLYTDFNITERIIEQDLK